MSHTLPHTLVFLFYPPELAPSGQTTRHTLLFNAGENAVTVVRRDDGHEERRETLTPHHVATLRQITRLASSLVAGDPPAPPDAPLTSRTLDELCTARRLIDDALGDWCD